MVRTATCPSILRRNLTRRPVSPGRPRPMVKRPATALRHTVRALRRTVRPLRPTARPHMDSRDTHRRCLMTNPATAVARWTASLVVDQWVRAEVDQWVLAVVDRWAAGRANFVVDRDARNAAQPAATAPGCPTDCSATCSAWWLPIRTAAA